jgi:hypothetical protein
MGVSFSDMYEGWRNILIEKINNKDMGPVVGKKMKICAECKLLTKILTCDPFKTEYPPIDFYYGQEWRESSKKYKGCGCYIPAKARSKSECPLGKWRDVK